MILGGTGMLGHKLWGYFSEKNPDTYTIIRKKRDDYLSEALFNSNRVIDSIDASDFLELERTMEFVKPEFILNCIGVTKRKEDANHNIQAITLNSLLPHKLVAWGKKNAAKIINFSTDCVFDGKLGSYTEKSPTNAVDIYGKTKALGEIEGENALTLRSSFIGFELGAGTELLEWFIAQTGVVKGFKNAIYSGVTVIELIRIIENLLVNQKDATGIFNISSEPISKYDLLCMIRNKLHLDVEVIPEETFCCDRSLDSTVFQKRFNYSPPSWEKMIDELS